MQAKEIDQILNDEFDTFMNSPYKGKIDIPENILELFKKAIMSMSPFAHKINFNKVKVIASKEISELSIGDLQDVIKVILSTRLRDFYGEFNYAVSEHLKIEKFVLSYNSLVEEFQKKLQSKKIALTNLSTGVNHGMKIIPSSNGQA